MKSEERGVIANGLVNCSTCGHTGPPVEFHEPDRRNLCLPCRRSQKRARRQAYVSTSKTVAPEKACSRCGVVRPISDFLARAEAPDGRDQRCKGCVNVVRQSYWDRTRDRRNAYQRDRKYGLALGEYDSMVDRQAGLCAICEAPPKVGPLVVDHCHTTGRVRRLLCSFCNKAIGLFGEDVEAMARAIDYINNHRSA